MLTEFLVDGYKNLPNTPISFGKVTAIVGPNNGGGHAELGGIAAFLGRIKPDATWERCFPTSQKPGPKRGVPSPVPSNQSVFA